MNVAHIAPGGANYGAAATVSPRIHQAATQFEAMLLQEMVKPLTKGFGGDDEDGNEKEAGPLQSFAGESVAGSLARSGALGVARQIEETLSKAEAKKMSQNSSSPAAIGR